MNTPIAENKNYTFLCLNYSSNMPLGPFGEVVGTTGTLDALGIDGNAYRSKVIAPRNPKLLKQGEDEGFKVMAAA